MTKKLALALLLLVAASCESSNDARDDRPGLAGAVPTAPSAAAASAAETGAVRHVVLCWLRQPGDAEAARKIIDVSYDLREIPGVVSVAAGRPIASTRPVVDSSFDVGVVFTFRDEAAMQAYERDPRHLRAVSEVLRPLTRKLQIYDVAVEPAPARKK